MKRRRYKLNPAKRRTRLILLGLLVLVILAAALVIRHAIHSGAYHDQSSFEKYTARYYSDFQGKKHAKKAARKAHYGEPLSTAVEVPHLPAHYDSAQYTRTIEQDQRAFRTAYRGLGKKDQAAFLVGGEVHKSPHHIRGVAIHEKQFLKKNGEETVPVDKVYTYNFSTRTGMTLDSAQVFQGDAIKKLAEKVNKQLENDYDGGDIHLKKLAAKSSLFSSYILTGKGVRFYFSAGTAADASAGVLHADLSYKQLAGVLRKDLGKRVIDPAKPMVAITYDDGPSEKYTAPILDVYEKYGQVATFFELGINIKEVPHSDKLLRRELALGCEVGTHSFAHKNLSTLSGKQLRADAAKAKKAIRDACGEDPTIFRAPYGISSKAIVKAYKLSEVNWSVDSLDWKLRNTQRIYQRIRQTKNFDGQIVLMHSIYGTSAKATAKLVPYLVKKGYQLVTVHELLKYKYHEDTNDAKNYGYRFIRQR